jgi:hypothetical protein
MKAQFIYSVAALATFPIVVNAQIEAVNIGKITALKDGTTWTKETSDLAKGKYTFKSTVVSTGTAGKKANVYILNGVTVLASGEFEVGKLISLDFDLDLVDDAKTKVTVKVVSEAAAADFVVDESLIQLNYDFTKVAQLLKIEYNKVTNALAAANYEEKAQDAQGYSALYDRIVAIAGANYAFYAADTEGLQAIYAGDQTNVAVLKLYQEIGQALTVVLAKEKKYQLDLLDGDDGLGGLLVRYNALAASGDVISYQTKALNDAKKAAEDARDAYNTDATAENLTAAKKALGAYGEALAFEEGVKKANEEAHNDLLKTLSAVYGGTNSYYDATVTQINTLYTARYADLKKDLLPALNAIVTGEDYASVTKAIKDSYEAKTAKSKKSELEIKIYEFKQKLTQKVSDFNTVKEQLAAVYETYDAEKEAADKLVKDAKDFLVTYKTAVDNAVKDLLDFIEANDEFTTVANLTDAKITAYGEAITAAKAEYTKQAGIYADYLALKDEVKAQTTSLDGVKDDIDKDAKDTKKLSEEKFKPTTLWNTTITGIGDKIKALDGAVDNNKTDATAFKAKDEYKKTLQGIKDAIKTLKENALQATALFAGYYDEYTTADELQKALMNPAVEPTDDLTKLNVWTNQVTIDDAVKARTPYKNFIDNTEGSITKAIATLKTKLNVMDDSNTGPLKGFEGTILDYLKTDAVKNAAGAVTTGTATMEAIKANYKADEQKFAQQMDIEECNGIRTNINNKALVFEAAIDVLEKNIKDGVYGVVKGKKLQDELDAITKKIDDAKAVAAKEDATKDDLTKAYNSIKDLMDTDIKTAKDNADDYAAAFKEYLDNYNELVGTKDDTSDKNTKFGLDKRVAEQKTIIDGYTNLVDAQKTTFKNNVDAVSVEKTEGDKKVTYTIANIVSIIEKAKNDEVLTDAEVTKYQNIIKDLKDATMGPRVQASYMNDLEGNLKSINFTKAMEDVLKADPNDKGFFYLLLTGETTKGQYKFDFNALKKKIEEDTNITTDEKNSYNGEIIALKALVDDAAAKAKDNLDYFKDAKKHYSNVPAAGSSDIKGALQRYDEAWEKLLKCPSSKLEEQKTVITGMKAALDQLRIDAETNYNTGKASANDAKNIDDQIKAIENKVEEYTNEANYNAQVAADNKAVYDRILAAREAVDAVYATSATVINTYKNFQSTELKAAADQAKTELQALLTYLEGYDAKVGKIKTDAKAEYDATVSPDFFDKAETYKAEYEKIQKEIEDLTKALTDKINELAGAKVAASVKNYTDAIDASKAKVAKFSVDDKDLTTAVLNNLFKNIDKLLKDINDVKEDGTKINLLDAALVAAAKENTGIYALIPPVEQDQAQAALQAIIALNTNSGLLKDTDKGTFEGIVDKATSTAAADRKACVDNFASYKKTLNDLKAKADQIAKDNKAISDAQTAINSANFALYLLNDKYQKYAAGYQVKETVEQIAADLAAYDAEKVTATNAADWEKAAKAISERIEAVYVALYDFEVPVIEGLIGQAREELLTYEKDDKATIAEGITIQENKLKDAKAEVEKYLKDPTKGKSKKATLLEDLKTIESALNGFINTILKANGGEDTNLNAVIVANLEAEVKVQEDILDAAPANYSTAIQTALTDEYKAIKADITTLRTYITTHKDEMSAYQANAEAMLKDIKDAIVALKAKADDLKAKEDAEAAEQALIALAQTWKTAEGLLTTADGKIVFMKSQLEAYGNGSKYANKVSKLDEQYGDAYAILTTAKAEAEGKEKTADKQKVADKAVTDITAALVGLEGNCDDVVALSKAAYIDAFIADLTAQIIEDSWSNSENYTKTDKQTLTTMRDNLIQSVALLKGKAEGKNQAGDQKVGNAVIKGVITTLNEGATQFGKDLNALVQAVKDLSLAEDVKGHITGGDEIGADDVQALINIIINGQEGEQDLEICDINGDGRITVTDIIWLQFFDIFHEWPNMAAAARGGYEMSDAVKMEVVSTRGNITRLAINLSNNDSYRAFQIGMQLPAGAKVVGQSLGDRVENAYLMHSQATEGNVRFMTIAFNSEFAGNEGAVLYVDVENLNGDVALTEAYFTNVELNEADLLSSGQTTSIRESITNALESAGQKIYNMGGRVMNGLKKGINIIRRNDGSNEKVIVK